MLAAASTTGTGHVYADSPSEAPTLPPSPPVMRVAWSFAQLTGPELVRALHAGQVTTIVGVPRLYEALVTRLHGRLARTTGGPFANQRGSSEAVRRLCMSQPMISEDRSPRCSCFHPSLLGHDKRD